MSNSVSMTPFWKREDGERRLDCVENRILATEGLKIPFF